MDKDISTEQKTCKVYNFGKRNVLGLDLNESREGFCRRGRGRSFHIDGPKTEKAREPKGESLVPGIGKIVMTALWNQPQCFQPTVYWRSLFTYAQYGRWSRRLPVIIFQYWFPVHYPLVTNSGWQCRVMLFGETQNLVTFPARNNKRTSLLVKNGSISFGSCFRIGL